MNEDCIIKSILKIDSDGIKLSELKKKILLKRIFEKLENDNNADNKICTKDEGD